MITDKIKKTAKYLRILFIVCLSLQLINLVSIIIIRINIFINKTENEFITSSFYFLTTIVVLKISVISTCIDNLRKITKNKIFEIEYAKKLIETIKILCCIIICSILLILLIGLVFQLMAIARAVGYTSLGTLTFIICTLTNSALLRDIEYEKKVQEYGSEEAYLKSILKEQQEKESAYQAKLAEKQKQKEIEKTTQLLNEIGIKFFIKYYDYLQHWSVLDLADIIEKNYSEQTKMERINKAKKLFELKLNVTALEIISNSENRMTDDETRNHAQELLRKEQSTNQ